MGKGLLVLGAVCVAAASMMSGAAMAATIVQYSDDFNVPAEGGFFYFDPSLGTLNSVTLAATTSETRYLYTTQAATYPFDLTWSVNGQVNVDSGSIPLTGSGSATFTGLGGLAFTLSGSGTFDLSPAGFVGVHLYPDNPYIPDFYITPGYSGIWDGSDLTLTTTPHEPAGSVAQVDGCGPANGSDWPREWCDRTTEVLTYNYTPFSAVPEPATWAMMLVGFGAMGLAMRGKPGAATLSAL